MTIAILANEQQKSEWLSKPKQAGIELAWASNKAQLLDQSADAYFDLLFQPANDELNSYSSLKAPVFINEVVQPFLSLMNEKTSPVNTSYYRLNAWPTFLSRDVVECSAAKIEDLHKANDIFTALGWKFIAVPDIPGLISARVIAMIINEAYHTLQDEVSTKKEIDTAMKLGTNYPYGPFEWSELIGLKNIYKLLTELSRQDSKYSPAELLKQEIEQQAEWH